VFGGGGGVVVWVWLVGWADTRRGVAAWLVGPREKRGARKKFDANLRCGATRLDERSTGEFTRRKGSGWAADLLAPRANDVEEKGDLKRVVRRGRKGTIGGSKGGVTTGGSWEIGNHGNLLFNTVISWEATG
jgi:hypothetical protein